MGRQFANDSMTPSPISVSRNQYKDEIPSDPTMHANATPEHTNSLYGGNQYAPVMGYGKSVSDLGQSPSKETVDVNKDAANRGKES